jgi:hypothetical protein
MDPAVVYVPRCVQNGTEILPLKALEDFDVGNGVEFVLHKIRRELDYVGHEFLTAVGYNALSFCER